jgi:hypothetical protein
MGWRLIGLRAAFLAGRIVRGPEIAALIAAHRGQLSRKE